MVIHAVHAPAAEGRLVGALGVGFDTGVIRATWGAYPARAPGRIMASCTQHPLSRPLAAPSSPTTTRRSRASLPRAAESTSATTTRRSSLCAEQVVTAQALTRLGEQRRVAGCYADAEWLHTQALALLGSREDLHTAEVLNALAVTYKYSGAFAEAERLYRRALAIVERELVPTIRASRRSITTWAGWPIRGRPAAAEPSLARGRDPRARARARPPRRRRRPRRVSRDHRRARPARRGRSDPARGPRDVHARARPRRLRGRHHAQQPRRDRRAPRSAVSQRFYRRSLALKQRLLGPEHPDAAVTLNNLGTLYHAQGRRPQAQRCLRRALTIYERTLAPTHPNLETVRRNLAAVI